MTHDAAAPVVLSPHLDDAVLSAWQVLSSARSARVVTVYAGVPEPGFVTDLDRAHGAEDSAAWLRRRREHDIDALGLAGSEHVHLDLLEVQFPAYRIPRLREAIRRDPGSFLELVSAEPALRTEPETLLEVTADALPPGAVVYGPAGVGGHPDHRDLAEATARLAAQGRTVRFYADSPYYLFHGPPSWLTGEPNEPADRWCSEALSRIVRPGWTLERETVRLPPAELARKLRAIRRYTTEFPSVTGDMADRGLELEMLRYEVYWTPTGTSGAGTGPGPRS